MSDAPKPEFTQSYAADVKARFEHLEKKVKEMEAFLKSLGYTPSK